MKLETFIKNGGWLLLFVIVVNVPAVQLHAAQGQTADSLKITEVYYNTPGSDGEEEWIELANLGESAIDLSAFKIGDEESSGGGEGMVQFPEGSLLEPEQIIVVAQSAAGFARLFGFWPAFEINDSHPDIPDMEPYFIWAGGAVGLANDGDELLLLDEENVVVDAVAFGETGESVPGAFRPPSVPSLIRGQSIERVPAGCDTDTAVDWLPQEFPTPGRLTLEGECRPAENPDPEQFTPIGRIQGQAGVAELLNQTVTFQGVVTGWIEDQNVAGTRFYTIFVQDAPGTEDGDPLTSDGIAVFLGVNRPSVQVGDLVLITGQVTEFFGLTEIDDNDLALSLLEREQPLPEPIPLQPPAANVVDYFEALEGMLVSLETAVVVGATFSGCGLAAAPPDTDATHYFRHQLADPSGPVINILHTSDVSCGDFPAVQVGDRLNGLSGPLHYHFDQFKIVNQEAADLEIESAGLPELEPPLAAGEGQITVATLNLHDYFDTVDDTGDEAEPKPTPGELAVKQAKMIQGIGRSLGCPTIIGVQEVENAALLQTLAEGLVEPCGFTYQVTHLESADSRGIDVALLSDPRRVNILNAALRQNCTPINTDVLDTSIDCPAGQSPLFSRPPLQVEAAVQGQIMTLFVNHFKSKREGEVETAPRRLAQGAHIRNLVEELAAADESANIIVMGDFNDFARSPVMEVMTADGLLVNVLMDGPAPLPPEEQYTYIFGGLAQLIDGILLSPSLAELVVETMILHANADFPYTLAIDTSEAGLPFFFSDHDVPLLLLNLEPEPPPTEEPDAPTPTLIAPPPATPVPAVVPEGDGNSTVGPLVWVLGLVGGTAVIAGVLFVLRRRV